MQRWKNRIFNRDDGQFQAGLPILEIIERKTNWKFAEVWGNGKPRDNRIDYAKGNS